MVVGSFSAAYILHFDVMQVNEIEFDMNLKVACKWLRQWNRIEIEHAIEVNAQVHSEWKQHSFDVGRRRNNIGMDSNM